MKISLLEPIGIPEEMVRELAASSLNSRTQASRSEVQVLQFKLTLDDFKPRVYRRVQVRSDMTMGQFAHVIMTLFRMEVSHLYAFAFPDYKVERKVAGIPFPLPPQPVRFELFGDFADDEPDGETLFDIADESLTLASVLARFPSKRFTIFFIIILNVFLIYFAQIPPRSILFMMNNTRKSLNTFCCLYCKHGVAII